MPLRRLRTHPGRHFLSRRDAASHILFFRKKLRVLGNKREASFWAAVLPDRGLARTPEGAAAPTEATHSFCARKLS